MGSRRPAAGSADVGSSQARSPPGQLRRSPAWRARSDRGCRRRSPRPPSCRASPPRSTRGGASGTSAPIDSPIAAATSRPTKSSSARGPIGWPAPSFMQVSIRLRVEAVALEQADGVEQVGKEQPVDHEAGGVGHLDRGLVERSQSSCRRRRVSSARLAGKRQLHQPHLSTGLNTCRAPKRSGRPLASASSGPRARRWWWRARRPRGGPAETLWSARLASGVLGDRLRPRSRTRQAPRARSLPWRHRRSPRARVGRGRAASPEDHLVRPEAARARPQAIAPLPAIPRLCEGFRPPPPPRFRAPTPAALG